MRAALTRLIVASGMAALIAALWSATTPVVAQSPTTYKAPRTADGQPDLLGIWQALNTANWDIEDHGAKPAPLQNLLGAYLAQPPGMSVVEGGAIPYKPEALARRKQNFETRLAPDSLADDLDVADPESKCWQPAGPRANYLPFPFQIFQTRNRVLMVYEFADAFRFIHLDKTKADLYDFDTPQGQSLGRWEGDTLVIETRGFSNMIWLDRVGNFMTGSAIVTERYTPTSPDHLRYEATIEDPNVFTRPWKMSMPLYRRIEPRARLLEFQCIPLVEEYVYGKLKRQ